MGSWLDVQIDQLVGSVGLLEHTYPTALALLGSLPLIHSPGQAGF